MSSSKSECRPFSGKPCHPKRSIAAREARMTGKHGYTLLGEGREMARSLGSSGRGAAIANAFFVAGIAMLWSAGFAASPARHIGDGAIRMAILLIPGVVIVGLGISWRARTWLEAGTRLPLACACSTALASAVFADGENAVAVATADAVLNGVLFYSWISLSLQSRSTIRDCCIPLGLMLGSLLAWCESSGFAIAGLTRAGCLNLSFFFFVLCSAFTHALAGATEARALRPCSPERSSSIRLAASRYGIPIAGSIALALVFGMMTDLHGWMATPNAAEITQLANVAATAALAVACSLWRRPFRIDAILAVALPLFAAGLVSQPAEAGEPTFSRLAIIVGYISFFVAVWVFVRRDAPWFRPASMPALSLSVGSLLAFSQIGRGIAAAFTDQSLFSTETLSAVSLSLFWVLILLTIGVYWLARSQAVDRDLTTLKTDLPAETAQSPQPRERRAPESEEAPPSPYCEGAPVPDNSVVYVDRVAYQARRLAAQIGLSARELEVLEDFARGRTAVSIAEKLFISPNTVKTHLRRIYEKGGIHSRQELLDMMGEF